MKNIDRLPFPELLIEFNNFKSKTDLKAERVYLLCLKQRHYKLAMDIDRKYNVINGRSDTTIAAICALTSINKD